MRPPAGGGKLKHAPPMQANNLLLVAQAVPPANCISSHLLTVAARIGVLLRKDSLDWPTLSERRPLPSRT